MDGVTKHTMLCEHRAANGRHPFICPKCWTYVPICVCGLVHVQEPLPIGLSQVVVWVHHGEWGLSSNTGKLLEVSMLNTTLLMKGLPRHDEELRRITADPSVLCVVLWPTPQLGTEDKSITLEELRRRVGESSGAGGGENKRIVLIALDASWRNAKRMYARLPNKVPVVRFPCYSLRDHRA